jgi:hypothetical protein
MKFRIIEDISRSGNWMVDEPERDNGNVDETEVKEEKAEGCPYRKFHRRSQLDADWWCTYYHKNKDKTTEVDIQRAIENDEPDEEITVCPYDIEECPIDRWTSQDFWTKEDWKDYYEESQRD